VKTTERDFDVAIEELAREIERARELIRLHADEHHEPRARVLDQLRELVHTHARVGLVDRMDLELDVAEDFVRCAIAGEAIQRRERVRRDRRAEPLDDIAVVVVMRRLH
jgi:hypothetical protein